MFILSNDYLPSSLNLLIFTYSPYPTIFLESLMSKVTVSLTVGVITNIITVFLEILYILYILNQLIVVGRYLDSALLAVLLLPVFVLC